MNQINILVSLHRGYGLGDAVQMSAVLRHVAKARPHWIIDYRAEEGQHQVGRGIVANTFACGQPHPSPHYDAEVQIVLYDTWYGFRDRPNTRVSSCLKECFDLDWDPGCGRYRVEVSRDAHYAARQIMIGVEANRRSLHPVPGVVAVHCQGDSSKRKKNLTQEQADEICEQVINLGRIPLVLGHHHTWGGSAEMNCAVISQCAAFVGIDSGPAKCASATDVPALVVWTGHHPAQFHDPADNTTHLVPHNYHILHPVSGDEDIIRWFESHYTISKYDANPVGEIRAWLRKVLR